MKESGEALLALVNDILDFSKIEARKLSLDRVPFDLRDVVEDAVRLLAPRAHEKALELGCRILPDVPQTVIGDPGRLRQVLVNLVGNAVKFTDHGEVIVDVALDRHDGDEAALNFTVSDTGIGIPAEKQWQIFGPFVQADASTTRRFGGTGLGLAISSQLVELMGGRIWIESEVGRGSRFHFAACFTLPPGSSSDSPHPAGSLSLEGLRVLVVDDNATNRRILEEMLRSWRMDPATAEAAAPALALLRSADDAGDPFRLVLIDALMPDVDGLMLAREIRRDARFSSAILIMLTSAPLPEMRQRARQEGFAACLSKPVKQSDLFDLILTTLGPPAAGAAGARRRFPASCHQAAEGPQHPRGGRQPDQPEAGGGAARAAGPPRGRRIRRKAGADPRGGAGLRPHPHGRPDAGDERPGSVRRDPRARAGHADARPDRGVDGPRHDGRPGAVPRGRHGRVRLKTPEAG